MISPATRQGGLDRQEEREGPGKSQNLPTGGPEEALDGAGEDQAKVQDIDRLDS